MYRDGNTSTPTLTKQPQTIGLNIVIHHSALNSFSCLKSSGFNQSWTIGGDTAVDYQMHFGGLTCQEFSGITLNSEWYTGNRPKNVRSATATVAFERLPNSVPSCGKVSGLLIWSTWNSPLMSNWTSNIQTCSDFLSPSYTSGLALHMLEEPFVWS